MAGSSFYQSGPGNYVSSASPFGAPGLGGGLNVGGLGFSDIMNIAIANAQQKQAQEQQMYGIKTKEEMDKIKWANQAHDPSNVHVPTPNEATDAARIKDAQLAQADAVSGRAPMRQVEGPGIMPGLVTDPNAMTGAQRQMFLPQKSEDEGSAIDAALKRRQLGQQGQPDRPLPSPMDMYPAYQGSNTVG